MTKTISPSTMPSTDAGRPAVTVRIVRAVASLWGKFQARRATVSLLELDERQLQDIGLSRGDVYEALATPDDAGPTLSARAARHRREEINAIRARLRSAGPVTSPVSPPALDRAA